MTREELEALVTNLPTEESLRILAEFDSLRLEGQASQEELHRLAKQLQISVDALKQENERLQGLNRQLYNCKEELEPKAEALERICEPMRKHYQKGDVDNVGWSEMLTILSRICDYLDSSSHKKDLQQKKAPPDLVLSDDYYDKAEVPTLGGAVANPRTFADEELQWLGWRQQNCLHSRQTIKEDKWQCQDCGRLSEQPTAEERLTLLHMEGLREILGKGYVTCVQIPQDCIKGFIADILKEFELR